MAVDQMAFASAVRAVAATMGKVRSVSIDGPIADVTFSSTSGKSAWQAIVEIAPETGHLTIRSSYRYAKVLRRFVDEVAARL